MASSTTSTEAVEVDTSQACQDTFPEIAYFEVPNDGSKGSSCKKNNDLVKHPVFREISSVNGEINRMNLKHLKVDLEKQSIDTRGTKDVLRKRLKAYERRRILEAAHIEDPNTNRQHYTHLLVIDFEATCEEQQTKDYVHEIIEFPAVLVDVARGEVVAEFHSHVRPVLNTELSPFCRTLTGIQQASVDSASCFPEVLQRFEAWLLEQGVSGDSSSSSSGGGAKLAVATDGPWDMARFLLMQCSVSCLPFPAWARSWINLRKVFSNFYVTKRLCLSEMLATLGLQFQGRPHCGLDDARNIAAIAAVLVRDGAAPRVNETIAHLPRYTPPTLRGSNVANVTLKEFESSERRRKRASADGRNKTSAVDGLCHGVDDLLLAGGQAHGVEGHTQLEEGETHTEDRQMHRADGSTHGHIHSENGQTHRQSAAEQTQRQDRRYVSSEYQLDNMQSIIGTMDMSTHRAPYCVLLNNDSSDCHTTVSNDSYIRDSCLRVSVQPDSSSGTAQHTSGYSKFSSMNGTAEPSQRDSSLLQQHRGRNGADDIPLCTARQANKHAASSEYTSSSNSLSDDGSSAKTSPSDCEDSSGAGAGVSEGRLPASRDWDGGYPPYLNITYEDNGAASSSYSVRGQHDDGLANHKRANSNCSADNNYKNTRYSKSRNAAYTKVNTEAIKLEGGTGENTNDSNRRNNRKANGNRRGNNKTNNRNGMVSGRQQQQPTEPKKSAEVLTVDLSDQSQFPSLGSSRRSAR